MLYASWKKFFKTNNNFRDFLAHIIYYYLRLVYSTNKITIIFNQDYDQQDFISTRKTIFTIWHNQLAIIHASRIFRKEQNCLALVSSHADGKLSGKLINLFGFKVIIGSTNKNSFQAVKNIMSALSNNQNIVLTPDGPRGPALCINSNVTQIATKVNAHIIAIGCRASKYFCLKSWDKLIVPLPFGEIVITVGKPLNLSKHSATDNNMLLEELTILSKR